MTEGSPYGSGELLLDQILQEEEAPSPHSYFIDDLERHILRTISDRKDPKPSEAKPNDPKLNDTALNQHLEALSDDLVNLSESLGSGVSGGCAQEVLRIRTHQLAIAKMLVFMYGKSDFRLAAAHFHQGRAYLQCAAYQQAANHLSIATTRIAKMSEIKDTKIYNSFILTALGTCYYQQQRYDYALEVLVRAFDIQNSSQVQKNTFVAERTLQMLARTYLRLKPADDSRGRREKEEARLKYQEEAVRLTDKLIDVLAAQFNDLDGAHKRVQTLVEVLRKSGDSEESIKRQEGEKRRKGEQSELFRLIELLEEKLDFLVIDYDRTPLRTTLRRTRGQDSRRGDLLEQVGVFLHQLLEALAERLKRQRIFKFKLLLSCALVTNSTDQELKVFMKQYEGEDGKPSVKSLSAAETIEIYKLLLSYASRFSDNESQMLYLRKLEEIYASAVETPQNQAELLALRRALAKLYAQMHMEAEGAQVLEQIKTLQAKLFGPASKPLRKTQSMLKLMKRESQHPTKTETVAKRLRKTVIVSTHAPRVMDCS